MAEGGEAYRVLLLGKTGTGKSSVGNSIIGGKPFKVMGGLNSTTKDCSWKTGKLSNEDVEVLDTPGLTDTHHKDDVIQRKIAQCLVGLSPGMHAALMVVKGKDRFTEEEFRAYCKVKKLLEGKNLTSRMIVVFTGGDDLEKEGIKLEDQIKDGSKELKQMLSEVENRYIVIDNNAPEEKNKNQMSQLMKLIKKVAPKTSSPVVSEMQEDVNKIVNTAVVRKRAASPRMSEKEAIAEVKQEATSDEEGTQVSQTHGQSVVGPAVSKVQHHVTKKNIFCTVL